MNIHTHTHTHIYTHTYIHTDLFHLLSNAVALLNYTLSAGKTGLCRYVCVCVCVCTCVCVCVRVRVYMYMYVCVYVFIFTWADHALLNFRHFDDIVLNLHLDL